MGLLPFLYSSAFCASSQKVDTTHMLFDPRSDSSRPLPGTGHTFRQLPYKLFAKEELKNLHALQVSDAVKHFAGGRPSKILWWYRRTGKPDLYVSGSTALQPLGYDGNYFNGLSKRDKLIAGPFLIRRMVDRLSLSKWTKRQPYSSNLHAFCIRTVTEYPETLTPRFKDKKKTKPDQWFFKNRFVGVVNPH